MIYRKARLSAIAYELAPNVITSRALEERVRPVYEKLKLPLGQLEALTGIRERRWWDPGFSLSEGAARAGQKALDAAGLRASELGALVYAGVCRESSEPATACAVAARLGVGADAAVYDVSNACLGALSGVVDLANRVELGQIRAGLVVCCESAREINESMIASMLARPAMDHFRLSIATLTGGSGAAAILVSDGGAAAKGRRLLCAQIQAAPQHWDLCRWERDFMRTDAAAVLKHGVALGRRTWEGLLSKLGRRPDKTVCHQVGAAHRASMLQAIGMRPEDDFTTYEHLGNMGTVSLPVTAAVAEEREFLSRGDLVAWLGIGSGLNCMMLGVQW